MSYQLGVRLARADIDFYALVIAAMIRADTTNAARLRAAFPDLWDETQRRYNAAGGVIDGEELTKGMSEWLDRRPAIARSNAGSRIATKARASVLNAYKERG